MEQTNQVADEPKNALSKLQERLPTLTFKDSSVFDQIYSGFHKQNLHGSLMVLPESTQDISNLLIQCQALSIQVVTHGGRTGLSGGAISAPGQLILDTGRLNQIIEVNRKSGVAVVECGVTLQALEEQANTHGLSCGIDLSARGSATIGGMVSTNAGGIEAFRNGVMRHRVLGLEVVLADGRILSDLKRVTKANEGYDLKQLFIGAEGTLGVVTKIVLSLTPAIGQTTTAIVSTQTVDQAVEVFANLRQSPQIRLLSAEIMWPAYARFVAKMISLESVLTFEQSPNALFTILEFGCDNEDERDYVEEKLSTLVEHQSISNAVLATNERQRNEIWRIREDSFVVDDNLSQGLWFDMSVPLNELSDYSSQLFEKITEVSDDLQVFLMGHLGDGNLHATITTGASIDHLADRINEAVYDGLLDIGGSFSAEHGIGTEKRGAMQQHLKSESLMLMKDIKQLFDPRGILNPGKVL